MKTQVGSSTRSAGLPVTLTAMLGREREITALRGLMRDPDVRMVTITGPGGVGKTRLAIAAASRATSEGEIEVIFVPLAAIRDPALVLPAIGQVLGLLLEPREEADDLLFETLAEGRTLLVLDNLEQVPGVAPMLTRILEQYPGLTILATSQVMLNMPQERLFGLAPLPVPPISDAGSVNSDAVTLFVQRARAVYPALEMTADTSAVIAEICRRLDGMPLAIELAAARANVLSPEALLDRLSDRLGVLGTQGRGGDDRHGTLRNAIAWTYDLLDPVEQRLFRHVAVFTGGCSVEAIGAVCWPGDSRDVNEVLNVLLGHSLVNVARDGSPRYSMLESLREFGVVQLTENGELNAAREAHAAWVASLAEQAAPHLVGEHPADWLARLEPEIGNIRAAIEWSLESGCHQYVARIIAAIWRFLGNRALVTDARRWIGQALSDGVTILPEVRSRALVAAGSLATLHRDQAAMETYMEQARHLAAAIGSTVDEMRAYVVLGIVAQDRGEYSRALELHARSEELARQIGDLRGISVATGNLGLVAYMQGRPDEAIGYWEETSRINVQIGDTMLEAQSLANLAALKNSVGRVDEAERHLERALSLQRGINNRRDLPATLVNLGEVALGKGNTTTARDYLVEAKEITRESGDAAHEAVMTQRLAMVALAEGNVSEAATLVLESLELLEKNREPVRILEVVEVLAGTAVAVGHHAAAVEMLAAASGLRGDHNIQAAVLGPERVRGIEDDARAALNAAAFAAAHEAGTSLNEASLRTRMRIVARQIVGRRVPEPSSEVDILRIHTPDRKPDVNYRLTGREHEVLQLLGSGRSTREISADLAVSPRTTAKHIGNIMEKMEVNSRTAAVARGVRDGVIRAGEAP